MNLSKRKFYMVAFFFIWLFSYLVVYVISKKNPTAVTCVYITFTIIMYLVDIKYKKWGLLNKISKIGGLPRENSQSTLYESTTTNTLSRFVGISIALLIFTVGYILMGNTKFNADVYVAVILLIISTICFLFALESQSTSVAVEWQEEERVRFTTFRRWIYIIGWHTLFLYVLLITSLIGKFLFLIGIFLYTSVLCYYYFYLD